MSKTARRLLCLSVVSASLLFVSAARATLAPFDGIGGNGGAPFRLDCGEYGILVGVIGRSGVVIDQVGGLCVKIDPISATWIGGVYETARAGGNGGSVFRKICPAGQAVMGLEGSANYFNGVTVVGSLNVKCIELGIKRAYDGPQIMGTRIVFNGDPSPSTIKALQDYCDQPARADGHNTRLWGRVGMFLEGRSGIYVDRVHLICGTIPQDKNGYRVDFRVSAKSAVPEGTPLQINWRASGVKPELTPNLQYSWELTDGWYTQASSGPLAGIPQPTRIQNPCSYALAPCTNTWFGSSSGSAVVFNALPPATYELKLTVRPTVSPALTESSIEAQATARFEIAANRMVSLSLTPNTVKTGGTSTAVITLEGPAPPRGMAVYLSSANPQAVSMPASIVVPGGQVSSGFALRANSGFLGGQTQITASLRKPLAVQATSRVGLETSSSAARVLRDYQAETATSGTVASGTPSGGAGGEATPAVTPNAGPATVTQPLAQSNRVVTQMINLPSDSKQATLTIQSSIATNPAAILQKRQFVKP